MNYEKHFENYLQFNEEYDLHPNLLNISADLKPTPLQNMIFYGPSGVGKYTQALKNIKQYSASDLKYEKKMTVVYNKQSYPFKISDIHYEIDISLLGCNAKLIWHEIYHQIIDILSTKTNKTGIILFKNFHEIHNELLETLYNYMKDINHHCIHIYYYLLTEQISFIPTNIIQTCKLIRIARPSKAEYKKCIQKNISLKTKQSKTQETCPSQLLKCLDKIKTENITNIKQLYHPLEKESQCMVISNKILQVIENPPNPFTFLKFRDILYEILIYHLNFYECIWYILSSLIERDLLPENKVDDALIRTYVFFQYFNNNYRPIYHLEQYFLSLISYVKGV